MYLYLHQKGLPDFSTNKHVSGKLKETGYRNGLTFLCMHSRLLNLPGQSVRLHSVHVRGLRVEEVVFCFFFVGAGCLGGRGGSELLLFDAG